MSYKLPSNPGVTVYSSPEEAKAAGVIDRVEQGNDGNLYATPHQGWLLRNMPWLIMGGMAAGAGAAALGGGAAAGAVPTTINAAGLPVNMSAAATAGITPLGGLGAAVGKGLVAGAGKSGPSWAADALGGGASGGIKGFLTDPKNYAGLAGLLTTLATRPGGNGGGGNADDILAQNPQLKSLLDMSVNRAERLDPLHQSITQLAMSRMPTNMQR